ncbi:MAG: M48 family metallopeptidase [Clostridia bacterium]|nr:M48 family metallopeptidase [Clostridia bacterium]
MFEDIRKNKIKTGFIVSIFILLVTLIVYYICMAFDLGATSIVIALIFSIGSAFLTYYNCDKIVLASCKARPATQEEDHKIIGILDALMISSGVSAKPRLYVVEDTQPNAFATGRNPEHAVICVTTGLLEKLEYYELEGVIAHELAHIKNYDIRLSAVISVMVGFIVMITDWLSRSFLWRDLDDDHDSKFGGIMAILGLLLMVLSPIFAKLLQLAVSRRREFLADATAVEFTRNPDGLISALQKISADPNELKTASSATAHMYISEPFRKDANKKRKTSWFSTHPSTEDRIEALRNIK